MIYNSIEELVGNTPLLRLNRFEKENGLSAQIVAKLEYLNPAGSIKDRVGAAMLADAEKAGKLKKGSVVIEATSGNTGIGLALAAAVKGYRLMIVMPENMSEERKKLMAAYGAELILTDAKAGMRGAILKAEELAREYPDSFVAGQFVNSSNPGAHYATTGPELFAQSDGKIDILVAGIGTGGTITGTGRYLKEKNPKIQVVGVEPASSPVLTKGVAGAHKIQGIGAGFVPDILDRDLLDEVIAVENDDAILLARHFGTTEGFLIGISAGAALFAAKQLAQRPENKNKMIAVILPDSGSRYLSAGLY